MKILKMISCLLVIGTPVLGSTSKISEQEELVVLSALNNICGDSWCGGDLEIAFKALTCPSDKKGCEIELIAQGYEFQSETYPANTLICELPGLVSRRDIIRYRSTGATYAEPLYDAVSNCISDFVEPAMLPLAAEQVPFSELSCLQILQEKPILGNSVADIFYEAENTETFAQVFFKEFIQEFSRKTSCKTIEPAATPFVCASFPKANPICGSVQGDFRVAVVKDFVDSARVVVSPLTAPEPESIPGISYEYNWQTLFLPDPVFCYDGLLDGGLDSQIHPVNISKWLPARDKRFIMAETLRELVENQSVGYFEDSCQKKIFEYPMREVNCRFLGQTGLDACVITPEQGGYYAFIWSGANPNISIIFNRYD
ncbi:MAG: hypothetical protein HRU19_20375 [Pseudobacteriovorax sp.]|nr:hypothetical protein [Pseudobacteriovorax sp.]